MAEEIKRKDIVQEIGGVSTCEKAINFLKNRLDQTNLSKMLHINHPEILIKIANAIVMCEPEKVFINTGSEEDYQHIKDLCLKKGEESKLAMDNHYIHFDLKEEQGRITDRTFYIVDPGENVSSLANKMSRADALVEIREKMTGIMHDKTMIIGFYMRGPVGAPVSNPAIEITSSAYVAHSAEILYRNSYTFFNNEVDRLGYFFSNIHSEGLNRPEDLPNARVFMDRHDQTTYSFNCTYAGNTLLLKKGNHRFTVDMAVYKNRGNELAEHMFITGLKGPGGRVTWFAGAAPSGCGKTTTAMAGDYFIGDDLAQIWRDEEGLVRAINPESGIFGIVEDVNWEGDPHLMEVLRKPGSEVIWSNVLIDENKIPYWTGNDKELPEKGINFQGPWQKGKLDKQADEVPVSHPNARCTVRSKALSNYSERSEDPEGVEIRIVTYSGRDSDTMPPVRAAKAFDYGVVIGASIVSAATATEVGASGIKRAPWANAPFIPGPLGDYMDSQFKFFGHEKIADSHKPILAGLNYFLTEESRGGDSTKLLGEKRDVKVWLSWLERLVHNEVEVIKTPVGGIPKFEDLKRLFQSLIGKDYTEELYNKQFSLYIDKLIARIELQSDAYGKEVDIPERLFEIQKEEIEIFRELKSKYGSVVTPSQLEEFESEK